MLNKGAMSEIIIQTLKLLLVYKTHGKEMILKATFFWGKMKTRLCDIDFYLVILCFDLNVHILFYATLCAWCTFALQNFIEVKSKLQTVSMINQSENT